jgi:hypothetical protein
LRSQPSATNTKGLDSLQALFLYANPRVARGSGRLPCGCHRARMRRIGPLSGQPSLFSLFALRVVARPNPPVSGYLSCPLIPYLKSLGGDRSV